MRGNCSLTVRVDDDELFGPSASGELRVGEAGYPDVVAALALAEGGDELASFAFDVDYDARAANGSRGLQKALGAAWTAVGGTAPPASGDGEQ